MVPLLNTTLEVEESPGMVCTSRGLLRDYEPSDGPSFESLVGIAGSV